MRSDNIYDIIQQQNCKKLSENNQSIRTMSSTGKNDVVIDLKNKSWKDLNENKDDDDDDDENKTILQPTMKKNINDVSDNLSKYFIHFFSLIFL